MQRHYFADKGLSNQGYGFSSSHLWMWELDHKEGWVPKNWCFWTVLLDKTLESPLDCSEIKSVNSKGNSVQFSLVQFSHSVVSNSSWPQGLQHARLPFHHQLPEFTQTHIHWVSDAIQPSHSLSSPSPPDPNPSPHQSLFQWVNSSHEVAKVLEFQL